MSESRRKRVAYLMSLPDITALSIAPSISILERLARMIQPTDRPAPKTHSASWSKWRAAQKAILSRIARHYPTPNRRGDRTGIKFHDGSILIRRADGSLRRPFQRVRRTGRIRRAEKALRRLNTQRTVAGHHPI